MVWGGGMDSRVIRNRAMKPQKAEEGMLDLKTEAKLWGNWHYLLTFSSGQDSVAIKH